MWLRPRTLPLSLYHSTRIYTHDEFTYKTARLRELSSRRLIDTRLIARTHRRRPRLTYKVVMLFRRLANSDLVLQARVLSDVQTSRYIICDATRARRIHSVWFFSGPTGSDKEWKLTSLWVKVPVYRGCSCWYFCVSRNFELKAIEFVIGIVILVGESLFVEWWFFFTCGNTRRRKNNEMIASLSRYSYNDYRFNKRDEPPNWQAKCVWNSSKYISSLGNMH